MQNVVLTVHLILALLLTGVVLLQRSEGGGLGMGGGGGGGVMTGRQAANALTRLTWIFGIAIFCTSIGLTVIAARESSNASIMDQLGVPDSQQQAPASNLPTLPAYTPPPTTGGDPLTPPSPDAPATAPAETAPAAPEAPAEDTTAAEPVAPPPAEAEAETPAETPSEAPEPAN